MNNDVELGVILGYSLVPAILLAIFVEIYKKTRKRRIRRLLENVRCPYCGKKLDSDQMDMISGGDITSFYDGMTIRCWFGCDKAFVLKKTMVGKKIENISKAFGITDSNDSDATYAQEE